MSLSSVKHLLLASYFLEEQDFFIYFNLDRSVYRSDHFPFLYIFSYMLFWDILGPSSLLISYIFIYDLETELERLLLIVM